LCMPSESFSAKPQSGYNQITDLIIE